MFLSSAHVEIINNLLLLMKFSTVLIIFFNIFKVSLQNYFNVSFFVCSLPGLGVWRCTLTMWNEMRSSWIWKSCKNRSISVVTSWNYICFKTLSKHIVLSAITIFYHNISSVLIWKNEPGLGLNMLIFWMKKKTGVPLKKSCLWLQHYLFDQALLWQCIYGDLKCSFAIKFRRFLRNMHLQISKWIIFYQSTVWLSVIHKNFLLLNSVFHSILWCNLLK